MQGPWYLVCRAGLNAGFFAGMCRAGLIVNRDLQG